MKLFLGTLVLIFTVVLMIPQAVQAEACTCFCGSTSQGAVSYGSMEKTACSAACQNRNEQLLGCFTSEDQWPENSELCWTNNECSSNNADNDWASPVPDCPLQPIAMGLCFRAPTPVTVMTAIAGVTSFNSLPEYIDALYRYAIPVMALLAVVMLMIGGLQYVLARGRAEAIKKAKDRIKNAVIGLVLLMSAYALARLIDPSLVNLHVFQVPMTKQVVLLDPNTTCEYLGSVGYEIDGKTGTAVADAHKACLTKGVITDVAGVQGNVVTGVWEEGDECLYSYCSDGQHCTMDGCKTCGSIEDPSEASCEEVSLEENVGSPTGKKYFCSYADLSGATYLGVTITAPACTQIDLNCTVLRSGNYQGDQGSCRSYDEVEFIYGIQTSAQLQNLQGTAQSIFIDLCTSDPCELAGSGSCVTLSEATGYDSGVAMDCVNSRDTPTGNSSTGITGGTCYSRSNVQINCLTGNPL